jgi:tetratricopeptide (TPR) repeat protein
MVLSMTRNVVPAGKILCPWCLEAVVGGDLPVHFEVTHNYAGDAARSSATRVIALDLVYRAESLFRDGMPDDALGLFEAAVEVDPSDATVWLKKCEFHLAREELSEAMISIERGLALRDDLATLWAAKFFVLEQFQGFSQEAGECLNRALRLSAVATREWLQKRFPADSVRDLQQKFQDLTWDE